MQRIFLNSNNLSGSFISLDVKTYHHLFNVCRLVIGDEIELVIDQKKILLIRIVSLEGNGCSFDYLDQWAVDPHRSFKLSLIQSLPKQDKLTEIARLCTSIGVDVIYPVVSSLCDVDGLSQNKQARIIKTIESAAKQSKQPLIPTFKSVQLLSDVLMATDFDDALKLVAYENETRGLSSIIKSNPPPHIFLAIGPEGGFSDDDLFLFDKYSFQRFSLGKSILRTEHAGFSAISYIDGYLESLQP